MGDSYRDAIRKQGKKAQNTSVSRAVAWSASKARAKVRAQHARESLHRRDEYTAKMAGQERLI